MGPACFCMYPTTADRVRRDVPRWRSRSSERLWAGSSPAPTRSLSRCRLRNIGGLRKLFACLRSDAVARKPHCAPQPAANRCSEESMAGRWIAGALSSRTIGHNLPQAGAKPLSASQRYSVLRTRIGETDAARLAGRKQARIAAASRTTATEEKATKSRAWMPKRRLCMARPTK